MSWDNGFFKREAKEGIDYTRNFETMDAEKVGDQFDFGYFDLPGGELEKREIKYNRNLLNEKNFAEYWTSGKHKGYKILKGADLDGDGLNDMIAVDPTNKYVVGFNERYVTDLGKGETPYRKNYYAQDKATRAKQSYTEYLDTAAQQEGWKDLSKMKENRTKSVWMVIRNYMQDDLVKFGATEKEAENICKQLLKIIQTSFFQLGEKGVPQYQIKVITESPEFKKVLKANVTAQTINRYLPPGGKVQIAQGMMQKIRGYGSNITNVLLNWLGTNQKEHRLSTSAALSLYQKIIVKQAANKLYKKHGLTAAEAATNPTVFNAYKAELQQELDALSKKYEKQEYTFDA